MMMINKRLVSLQAHPLLPANALLLVADAILFFYLTSVFAQNIFGLASTGPGLAILTAGQGSLFWQVMTLTLFLFGLGLPFLYRGSWRKIINVSWPLWPLIIWVLFSSTWSSFPDISSRRAFHFAIEAVSLICFAAVYSDRDRLLRVLFYSFGFIVLADIAFLAIPEISYTPIGYAGVHGHKNEAGEFCFLALPIFVLATFNRRIFGLRAISLALTGLCLVVLALSMSKTSWGLTPICAGIAYGILVFRKMSPANALIVGLMISLLAAIAISIISNLGINEFLAITVGDVTFSGRDRLWDYTINRFQQSPIIGQGYGALWGVNESSYQWQSLFGVSFDAGQAHNGYLDILAQLGLVGFLLMVCFILITFVRLVRNRTIGSNGMRFIATHALVGILFYNITESSFARAGVGIWVYFILVTHNVLIFRRTE